jgi:hypothetical protein
MLSAHTQMGGQTFLHHRMASEATTMVMADMRGVHTAGLREQGYDTSKRRIYPTYEAIVAHNPQVRTTDVLAANIDFCFTGSTTMFEAMGVPTDTLETFSSKYDTFFSADYDWNAHNFDAVSGMLAANPAFRDYFLIARDLYELPLVDDLYKGCATKEQILGRFVEQIQAARAYTPHHDEVRRMKEVARRYFGGQLAIFYLKGFEKYRSTHLFETFLTASRMLFSSTSATEIQEHTTLLQQTIRTILDAERIAGAIDSQGVRALSDACAVIPCLFHQLSTRARYNRFPQRHNCSYEALASCFVAYCSK